MNILGINVIGSYIWNMQHENSDIDMFIVSVEDTKNILMGTSNINRSKHYKTDNIDVVIHEVGKVVEQLIKGNINFIIGVLSPINIYTNKYFEELREITRCNLAKNCYHSVNGVARQIYTDTKHYENKTKRMNTIMRMLNLGINILEHNDLKFEKVENVTVDDIFNGIRKLDDAYKNSSLPDEPNEDVFREWLYKLRKDIL